MKEWERNHEFLAHTIVEKSGERSEKMFFIKLENIKKEKGDIDEVNS